MGKIRFTKDVATKEETPQVFKAGDVVDFYELYGEDDKGGMTDEEFERNRRIRADASANRWVNRGVAEEVDKPDPAKARKGVKSAPPAPPEKPVAAHAGDAADKSRAPEVKAHDKK